MNVSAGEGRRQLYVNVSGQSDLASLDFFPPEIASMTPAEGPTSGGLNLTLTGTNFGAGTSGSFDLRVGNYEYGGRAGRAKRATLPPLPPQPPAPPTHPPKPSPRASPSVPAFAPPPLLSTCAR